MPEFGETGSVSGWPEGYSATTHFTAQVEDTVEGGAGAGQEVGTYLNG